LLLQNELVVGCLCGICSSISSSSCSFNRECHLNVGSGGVYMQQLLMFCCWCITTGNAMAQFNLCYCTAYCAGMGLWTTTVIEQLHAASSCD
jgi:uncharacterized protein CbrC (UPF0167 family)